VSAPKLLRCFADDTHPHLVEHYFVSIGRDGKRYTARVAYCAACPKAYAMSTLGTVDEGVTYNLEVWKLAAPEASDESDPS
jgi:hypothetical protein